MTTAVFVDFCPACDQPEPVTRHGRFLPHGLSRVTAAGPTCATEPCEGAGMTTGGAAPTGGRTVYPCGTPQARRRHRYHGEGCERCGVEEAPSNVAPRCGTARGFANHALLGEKPCAPCVAAQESRGRRRLRESKAAA